MQEYFEKTMTSPRHHRRSRSRGDSHRRDVLVVLNVSSTFSIGVVVINPLQICYQNRSICLLVASWLGTFRGPTKIEFLHYFCTKWGTRVNIQVVLIDIIQRLGHESVLVVVPTMLTLWKFSFSMLLLRLLAFQRPTLRLLVAFFLKMMARDVVGIQQLIVTASLTFVIIATVFEPKIFSNNPCVNILDRKVINHVL